MISWASLFGKRSHPIVIFIYKIENFCFAFNLCIMEYLASLPKKNNNSAVVNKVVLLAPY